MLIYKVGSIPDLTLSKYQAFADIGIDGMLEAQTQFIRQMYRVALVGRINIHFIFNYDEGFPSGKKLQIYIIFSGNEKDNTYYMKLRKIVEASNVSQYFQLLEIRNQRIEDITFSYMSILRKKERFLQTIVNDEEQYFYVVPNWKMNEKARLYNLIKLMQSFNEKCCYRVDLYVEKDMEEQIHKNFERPLSYLRNLSRRDNGISDYFKLQQEKRDPNADETLRQYEEWLKAVDTFSVFRCRICAFSNDEQSCQLLLDSVISECIDSGNATISNQKGEYSVLDFFNKVPEDCYSKDAPRSMKNWATTFTTEEIAMFVRLPVLYDGENIELPKETSPIHENEGIIIGRDKNNYEVKILPELFPKHMFVCGVPGSGKTNTMLHIANSLWNHKIIKKDGTFDKLHIPFLVLEPAKKEYRELALFDIPELLIFSPSASTDFPIKINPFEFARGLTLSEHISKLCQVFEGAFPIPSPAPFILDKAIQAIYEKHEWDVNDVNLGIKKYPTMSELYEQFEKELLKTSYDSEIRGNIRSVLEMRIGSLLRREMKEIFDVSTSTISPEQWLEYPIVIELEALGEGIANFVTLLLCTLIREVLKVNPFKNEELPVRHVIFIEEAHNLIATESQVKDGLDSNPKIAATAFIVKMLAEVRALREGIIIADQLPTAMAPEVIKNTNIKLVHRLTASDDRGLVGNTMSASPLQIENMAIYTKGQALYTYEQMLRPFEIRVCKVEEHENEEEKKKISKDITLYEIMLRKRGKFFEFCKLEAEEQWKNLEHKVFEWNETERKVVQQLEDFNSENFSYNKFEKQLKTCTKIMNGFRLMKSRLLLECSFISERFIEKEKKDKLNRTIQQLGTRYENEVVNVAIQYVIGS